MALIVISVLICFTWNGKRVEDRRKVQALRTSWVN